MNGPKAVSREQRFHIAREIADRITLTCGPDVKAIGLYGSLGRQTDGPYSDIEMFCVLRSSGNDYSREWSAGDWKAEVNFVSEDTLLAHAANVEGDWPLTHGAFFNVKPLHDPEHYFAALRQSAESPGREAFRQAVCDAVVQELYEYAGKWRNIGERGPRTFLPSLAAAVAKTGAMIVGLHNRTYYTTSATVLPEALALPERPDGFDGLCRMVMSGALSDSDAILGAFELLWKGTLEWAERNGYVINASERIPF